MPYRFAISLRTVHFRYPETSCSTHRKRVIPPTGNELFHRPETGYSIRNKIFAILVFALLGAIPLRAQDGYKPATTSQVKEMRENISAASAGMKTLRCDFEQTKTLSILAEDMLSYGFMTYRQPDMLHWEYTRPYHYVFAISGGKVVIESGDNKNEIDIESNKLFREITSIIISGINGQDIFNETKFSLKYLTGASGYLIIMTPKQKEIKQMFDEIHLYFDSGNYTVNTVEMKEASGDKTVIRMKNKKIN